MSTETRHRPVAEASPHAGGSILDAVMARVRPAVALLFGFSVVANLFKLVFPLFLLQVVDRVLSSRDTYTLVFLTLIAVFALAAGSVINVVVRIYQTRLGSWVEGTLLEPTIRSGVNGRLNRRSLGPQILRDLTQVGGFFGNNTLSMMFDLPWVLIFMTVLYLMSPVLGAIATAFAVVLVILAFLHGAVTRSAQDALGEETGQAAQMVARGFQNAEVIHAMGLTDRFLHAASTRSDLARAGKDANAERGETLMMAIRGIRQMAQICVLAAGAFLVIEGSVSAGVMIAGSILLGLALSPIDQAPATWRGWLMYRDSSARLRRQLATLDESALAGRASATAPRGDITVTEALYLPPGQRRPVLRPISFSVGPGETVGIIGSSGSGKSVLVRMALGLLPPTGGSVQLDGVNMHEWLATGIGTHIGYQPQDLSFLAGTVGDNIARFDPPSVERAARLQAAAGEVGVLDTILNLPQGMETDCDVAVATLSRGTLQQLSLARAFYGDPQIIVLDEPTTFLDRVSEQALVEALDRAKARGATTLLVTQRSALLRSCDRLILLRDGMMDGYGPPDTVLERLRNGQRQGPANLRLASN